MLILVCVRVRINYVLYMLNQGLEVVCIMSDNNIEMCDVMFTW